MAELARITRVKPGRAVTPIRAQAKIERASESRYRLQLRTQREDQTGDTDLDATTCPVLKRGVTLVLALALGDGVDLVDEKAPPQDDTPARPAVLPAHPPQGVPVAPKPVLPRAPALGLRVAPWLAASGAWGQTAKPAFGPQIGLEWGQTHWHALALVSLYPARAADTVQGVDAAYGALTAALGGCARAPFGAWALAGCASFEIGGIRGSARWSESPCLD